MRVPFRGYQGKSTGSQSPFCFQKQAILPKSVEFRNLIGSVINGTFCLMSWPTILRLTPGLRENSSHSGHVSRKTTERKELPIIDVVLGCFGPKKNCMGFNSRFTWWFHHPPGKFTQGIPPIFGAPAC